MISAVVLAAGLSSRMGQTKLVLKVDGKPILESVLEALRRSKVDEVIVVLGADADRIRDEIRFRRERLVVNDEFAEGMGSSIRVGLRSVDPRSDAALVVLGDQPLTSPSTIDAIVDGFLEGHAPVAVPVHKGIRGNPILFARSVFPEVVGIGGDVGAKSVVKKYGRRVLEVPVEDAGVLEDVDTPADYDRIRSTRSRRRRNREEG